jgi:hypothetical protein
LDGLYQNKLLFSIIYGEVLVGLYFPPAPLDETGYTLDLDAFRPRNFVHQLEIYHFSTRAELKENLNRRGFVFTALSFNLL